MDKLTITTKTNKEEELILKEENTKKTYTEEEVEEIIRSILSD